MHLEQAQPAVTTYSPIPRSSNFSGVQHSLEWIAYAQAKGWDVLLDAAAFAYQLSGPGSVASRLCRTLVLTKYSATPPRRLPPGRRAALPKLHRLFAGGTITVASVQGDRTISRRRSGVRRWHVELSQLACRGKRTEVHRRHRLDTIHTRVMCLTGLVIGRIDCALPWERDVAGPRVWPLTSPIAAAP